MADPFIGELRIFGFNFPPKGWAFCNGQILQIAQNQALFALLGTTYGGNGQITFALPNLQSRVPIHFGTDPNGIPYNLGQIGGEENHTLINSEMPMHAHVPQAVNTPVNAKGPANNYFGQMNLYTTSPPSGVFLDPQALSSAGSSQPHPNLQPYLTLNVCIALVGIFPSRN